MKRAGLVLLTCALVGGWAGTAQAIDITVGPDNDGVVIDSLSVLGTTVTINETWSNPIGSFLQADFRVTDITDRLDDFKIIRNITNNTSFQIGSVQVELFDPDNGFRDTNDGAFPTDTPSGLSTSSNDDGLFFPISVPVTSDLFGDGVLDVDPGRDFVTFDSAIGAAINSMFWLQFGVADGNADIVSPQGPFPNQAFSIFTRLPGMSAPEPDSLALLGLGLAALAFWRRSGGADRV